ncbi:MAG TPA: hypothetical protein VGF69_16440 [Thermoanaerobaculia bacterium]|jgi:hypothetical protein
MYALLVTDALIRIALAVVVLFVGVPALARRRPAALDRLEWFWWCFAAGVIGLTLVGQLLTLLNVFSAVTLLVAIVATIVFTRARLSGRTPVSLVRETYQRIAVSTINVLEGRVNVRRRLRRAWRKSTARLREVLVSPSTRWSIAGWCLLVAVSASLRLIRPFSTANLGFSDTYAHLYLFRLLEQGLQVDPAWGPYPRGMHFLLLTIHELTNVDPILLMNLFGSVVGVLMTLAVADAARRMSGSLRAGLLAGLLFATMTGGAAQYFLLGGSVATLNAKEGREFVSLPHEAIPPTDGEYDVLQTVFQRQTATLPQELAIVFLFPAAMFLFRWMAAHRPAGFRLLGFGFWRSATRGSSPDPHHPDERSTENQQPTTESGRAGVRRWMLTGYLFCTASIAAVHPGVAIPLIVLSAITVLATLASWRDIRDAALTGAAGIFMGSTWLLAYVRYRRIIEQGTEVASGSDAGSAAMYYFPFLRQGETARIVTWVAITPVVAGCAVVAVALIVLALIRRERRAALLWPSLATLAFLVTHVASRYGLPEIVEVRRNSSWLAMAMAVLIGVALFEIARAKVANVVAAALLVVWCWRVPVASANDRLINYSGYSATAYTVLDIERRLEPFTWTLVTYGQEFPMVLGKGFHLSAADFLNEYDPEQPRLHIPTKYVFIVVEKTPHRFQINTWKAQFSRGDLQRRLQTWCFLYHLRHRDIRIYHDDQQVRVYVIQRSDAEVRMIAEGRP